MSEKGGSNLPQSKCLRGRLVSNNWMGVSVPSIVFGTNVPNQTVSSASFNLFHATIYLACSLNSCLYVCGVSFSVRELNISIHSEFPITVIREIYEKKNNVTLLISTFFFLKFKLSWRDADILSLDLKELTNGSWVLILGGYRYKESVALINRGRR